MDQGVLPGSSSSLNNLPIPNDPTQATIIHPQTYLPNPQPPWFPSQNKNSSEKFDIPAIGKFIRDRSSSLSSSILKRLSSKEDPDVARIDMSSSKVWIQTEEEEDEGRNKGPKGRVTFFSRSSCRDCLAVRTFFRSIGLDFVEINIDVFPLKEKDLIERTGSSSVPQIFFNEKLIGGLVDLNSMRKGGVFESELKEMMGRECSNNAPVGPLYGLDDPNVEDRADEMMGIVRILRQRLRIQDRVMKMKIVRNCFSGQEMVEFMIRYLGVHSKGEAIAMGKAMAKKHFIHHVFGEHEFEDGNNFYRFLEHEHFIPKCVNFRGYTSDYEPKPALTIAQRLNKIMSAILDSYASDDRSHVDYTAIGNSEEFRRYVNLTGELHRVNLATLSWDEKLAFFLNLHNAMVIHEIIRGGRLEAIIDRRSFFSDFQYLVGGYAYSLSSIKNGILRNNRRHPYSFIKPFGARDGRLEMMFPRVNSLIHFGLCEGTSSSPAVRFFSPQGIEVELRCATREFFHRGGVEVDLVKRTVYLTRIIKWFDVDFGSENEILEWIVNYLDAPKAGLIMHLLGDGCPVNIVYQNYGWSIKL